MPTNDQKAAAQALRKLYEDLQDAKVALVTATNAEVTARSARAAAETVVNQLRASIIQQIDA
jgi:hypothetical protein